MLCNPDIIFVVLGFSIWPSRELLRDPPAGMGHKKTPQEKLGREPSREPFRYTAGEAAGVGVYIFPRQD